MNCSTIPASKAHGRITIHFADHLRIGDWLMDQAQTIANVNPAANRTISVDSTAGAAYSFRSDELVNVIR